MTKIQALFTQYLIYNGMSLLLASEKTGSNLKLAETKECSKNVDICITKSKA